MVLWLPQFIWVNFAILSNIYRSRTWVSLGTVWSGGGKKFKKHSWAIPTPVDYESLQNEAPELKPDQQTVPQEYRHIEFMHDYQGIKRSDRLTEAIDEGTIPRGRRLH